MRITTALSCLILCLSISGCARQSLLGPPDHYTPKKPVITFVRNQNYTGGTVVAPVNINGWMVGTLGPGEHLTLQKEPGVYEISSKGLTVPLSFEIDREYFVLIDQESDGSIKTIRKIYGKEAAEYIESTNYQTSR